MPHYQAFDPHVEMIGMTASGFIKSLMHDDITDILARHQLDNIDPQGWYPVQNLLDVMSEISEGTNITTIFVSIGMAAVEMGLEAMPEAMKALSIQEFFSKYDAVWKSRHRNGDPGSAQYELVDENHIIMRLKTPFPDDIFYGGMYAYARFFCPKGKTFSVAYDENIPTRDAGGDVTVIHIRLKN